MNKRIIPLVLLSSAMLLVGCGNKNSSQQGGSGANPGTSTSTPAPTGPVTFDFTTLAPTSSSSSQQVFEQGGVNFTNNQASSTSAVVVKNPIRCYQNSEIVVSVSSGTIAKLEFLTQNFTDSGSGKWAYSFKGTEAVTAGTWNAPAAVSGQDTNSSLNDINAASVTITCSACQIRIKSMTVTFA